MTGPIVSIDDLKRDDIAKAFAIYPPPLVEPLVEGFLVSSPRNRVPPPGCYLDPSAVDSMLDLVRSAQRMTGTSVEHGASIIVYVTTKDEKQHEIAIVDTVLDGSLPADRRIILVDRNPHSQGIGAINAFVAALKASGCNDIKPFS